MARRIPKLHVMQVNRFWTRVDSSGGVDACWLWTGHTGENGYGIFGIKGRQYGGYDLRRPSMSKPTAATSTAPLTMYCV